jgi:imidazolonepropionase-like amidohydrolase
VFFPPCSERACHLAESGVRIAFGTDTGAFFNQNNAGEVAERVANGIAPIRAPKGCNQCRRRTAADR